MTCAVFFPPVAYAAGILLRARSTGRVLLLLRRDGRWATPGGHIEPGETEAQAARREFREEVGPRSFTMCDDGVWIDGYVLFWAAVAREFRPVLNEEHTAYQWACPEDAPEPLHPGLREVL